jgi:hypothetical protein
MTKLELEKNELDMFVDGLNVFLDMGLEKMPTSKGDLVVIRKLLKKLFVAGLESGDMKLPECFTGDKELMAAAAKALQQRETPDPDTVH